MADAHDIARRILDLSEPLMLATGEAVALATKVVELLDSHRNLTAQRDAAVEECEKTDGLLRELHELHTRNIAQLCADKYAAEQQLATGREYISAAHADLLRGEAERGSLRAQLAACQAERDELAKTAAYVPTPEVERIERDTAEAIAAWIDGDGTNTAHSMLADRIRHAWIRTRQLEKGKADE